MSGFLRAATCSSLFALVLLTGVLSSTNAPAQQLRPFSPEWLERCKRWIERKGYPVDYIEQKTGKRQPGFAANWKGNVKPDEVQVGDVAIISFSTDDGRSSVAAAYIESVEPPLRGSEAFVTGSSMNWAKPGERWVDQECFVTNTFGQVVRMREPLSSVVRVWRPSLPLE